MNAQIIFTACMLMVACIGAYCAHKLGPHNPWWVRFVVMLPALLGLFAPILILKGDYVAYPLDVAFAISVVLLYGLVASRFSCRPWLDIRVSK